MARGRPRKLPDETSPSPSSKTAAMYERLFPGDQTRVVCRLCNMLVPEIAAHLADSHRHVTEANYQQEFPSAPLQAPPPPPEEPPMDLTVTDHEAARHPCGREGAAIEKMLGPEEARPFQDAIRGLTDRGYPADYAVAALAYQMILARRFRIAYERTRQRSQGEIWSSQELDMLAVIESRIEAGRKELERARVQRLKESEDFEEGHRLVERELAEAEQFLLNHQGELSLSCPGCSMMLSPPGLPHWAYAPIQTKDGIQWPVWSREAWELVIEGTLPLWAMAYILRTSPEGLRVMAGRRHEPWPTGLDLVREERQLRERLDLRDRLAALTSAGTEKEESSNGQPDRV